MLQSVLSLLPENVGFADDIASDPANIASSPALIAALI